MQGNTLTPITVSHGISERLLNPGSCKFDLLRQDALYHTDRAGGLVWKQNRWVWVHVLINTAADQYPHQQLYREKLHFL